MAFKVTPRSKVSEFLELYRTSGLSQQKFSDEYGLKKSTLVYWLKRERAESESHSGFVRLTPSAQGPEKTSSNKLIIDLPTGARVTWSGTDIPSSLLSLLDKAT